MKSSTAKTLALVLLAGFLASAAALAQDIPLHNWTVPPYRAAGGSGGLSTMADISNGVAFTAVLPCRLVDTRQFGFPAGYGQPALVAGVLRNFDLNSQPNCTGIPSGVEAYSLNFTVTQTQGPGFLKVFPQGGADPGDVSTINYVAGQTIANAAIVPAGTGGGVSVIAGVSGTHVIIDINGYFTDIQNAQQFFEASGSYAAGGVIYATNSNSTAESAGIRGQNNTTGGGVYGVWGEIGNTAAGGSSAGVRGQNYGTGTGGIGVWGSHAGGGWGVYGTSVDSFGVRGLATNTTGFNIGVGGETNSNATGSNGVQGFSDNESGVTYGVRGINDSSSNDSAGVIGTSNLNTDPVSAPLQFPAGVRGEGHEIGVLGISEVQGVRGILVSAGGANLALGTIGYSAGLDPPGVAPWSFFGFVGDLGNVDPKSFVEPHRKDPSKVIQYISLEGPEAGTYFRGRGKFERGIAKIEVPEDFRMVTDPEGLTVQITPIGAMATVGVMRMDLSEIVVQSSRNVEFSYLVQGVRAAYKDRTPIRTTAIFVPESADAKMPNLVDGLKRVLIENGTYNADGTVNMETAKRLGWDKVWEAQRLEPMADEDPRLNDTQPQIENR